jgi:transposase
MARPPLSARPPTDAAEERTLRKLASARHAPASLIQRARIVTGSWDGASVAELAQRLGCHPKTVYKWLHRFNEAHGIGGLADLPRPGVPRRLTETERGRIIALARSQPPGRLWQGGEGLEAPADPEAPAHWTLDALAATAQAEESVSAAARSAGSCWPNGCAGGGPARGRPAPTRTSPQKSPRHRPLHHPARGDDGDLRRRTRPGDPSQLPARARLDP